MGENLIYISLYIYTYIYILNHFAIHLKNYKSTILQFKKREKHQPTESPSLLQPTPITSPAHLLPDMLSQHLTIPSIYQALSCSGLYTGCFLLQISARLISLLLFFSYIFHLLREKVPSHPVYNCKTFSRQSSFPGFYP